MGASDTVKGAEALLTTGFTVLRGLPAASCKVWSCCLCGFNSLCMQHESAELRSQGQAGLVHVSVGVLAIQSLKKMGGHQSIGSCFHSSANAQNRGAVLACFLILLVAWAKASKLPHDSSTIVHAKEWAGRDA